MKFLVQNYSWLQNPWLGGYGPQIPILSVLCPQLNLLNPPPKKFLGMPLTTTTTTPTQSLSKYMQCQCFWKLKKAHNKVFKELLTIQPSYRCLNEMPPEGCLSDHIVLIINKVAYTSFCFLVAVEEHCLQMLSLALETCNSCSASFLQTEFSTSVQSCQRLFSLSLKTCSSSFTALFWLTGFFISL